MGFFDDIFADVRTFTDEIQNLKEELVSSVLDPTGELRDTVNEIAGELTGTGTQVSASTATPTDDPMVSSTPIDNVQPQAVQAPTEE